ncbi:MAG: hypothetical protein ACXVZW_08620 [Gaiellaceae bacterium]
MHLADFATAVGALVFALLLLGLVFIAVATALKGKWWTFLLGIPISVLWFVGAMCIAKPDSFWARHFYGPEKLNRARARFPTRQDDYEPAVSRASRGVSGWRIGG